MREFLREYLAGLLVFLAFYSLHKMLVIHGKKVAYIFWGLSELVLLVYYVKMFTIDIVVYAPSAFIVQATFVFFVRSNIKNKERNVIYDFMTNTEFKLIFFLGIDNLEEEQYKQIRAVVEKIFNGKFGFCKKVLNNPASVFKRRCGCFLGP